MSSATTHATALKNVSPSSSTAWRHLLWKDFRQVWQLIVGIIVIAAFLQLMLGLCQKLFGNELQELSQVGVNIALASPTLLAIAISGILMGQERQTGCWTWSSSLPVGWLPSLMSKVLVWLGASVATVVILLANAAIVLSINHTLLFPNLFGNNAAQVMTLVLAVQVFIYCSIATLLIKDTLLAIAITAFALFTFHIQVAFIGFSSVLVPS